MKQVVPAALVAALCASPALAQEPKKATTEQERRQAACTKQANDKGVKGRERSQFVTNCMRAAAQPAKK
jgi:hypothetical protein